MDLACVSQPDANFLQAEASHPVDEREVFRQTISSTRRLFVRNLTFSCTLEELQALFSRFGQIEQVSTVFIALDKLLFFCTMM